MFGMYSVTQRNYLQRIIFYAKFLLFWGVLRSVRNLMFTDNMVQNHYVLILGSVVCKTSPARVRQRMVVELGITAIYCAIYQERMGSDKVFNPCIRSGSS